MELGDLAWDYTEAWDVLEGETFLDKRICIVLEYPDPPSVGRTVKVLTLTGVVKQVPVEFISPM